MVGTVLIMISTLQTSVDDIGSICSRSGGFGCVVKFLFGDVEFGAEGFVVSDFMEDVQNGLGCIFYLSKRRGFGC